MNRKLLLAFAVAALAIASAKSYNVTLYQAALLGNTELKPGDYKVEVVDQNAVLTDGKSKAQAPVKVESVENKYNTTSVRFTNGDGKMHVQEIHLGGTKTKLVFNE
ncbi:MAG TPA: hypothetical protein VG675_05830 [Bryobacteraceae bacterium]|nr:hypothetical protein [Bryobacteraceae bacterium]